MALRLRLAAMALAWLGYASLASAQFQPSGNTSGLGGVSGGSTGGGLGTTAGGTQSGSGTGGMFGSRSLGSSLSGGSRTMSGGRGVTGSTRTADAAGTVTGSERFVRGNRQGQFVGSDTTDLRNIFSAMGQNQRGQQGFQNRNQQNQNPNQGLNDQTGMNNRRPVYRTQRVVDFEYRLPTTAAVSTALGTRISRAVRVPGAKIEVLMQDRTALLQGTVPNAHARDLAAQLALLEPGVSEVQNDLQIAPAGVVPPRPPAVPGPELRSIPTTPTLPPVDPNQPPAEPTAP